MTKKKEHPEQPSQMIYIAFFVHNPQEGLHSQIKAKVDSFRKELGLMAGRESRVNSSFEIQHRNTSPNRIPPP